MSTASTRICAPIKQMGIIPKTMQDIAFYKWNCTLNPYWAHITQNICTHRLHQCRMCLIIRLNKTGRRRKIDGIRGLGDFRIGTSVKSWSRECDFSFIQSPHGAAATVERCGASWSIDRSVPMYVLWAVGSPNRSERLPIKRAQVAMFRVEDSDSVARA